MPVGSDNVFNYIKEQVKIQDLIGEYIPLEWHGTDKIYLKGICPNKDKLFFVSPTKQIYYCWGCHKGGDIISFYNYIHKLSPVEAAKKLIERYNISVPEKYNSDFLISDSPST